MNVLARLPQPYQQWNQILAQRLFPPGRVGVPVYLAVHDALLNDCGARAGCGGRNELVGAVLGLSTTSPPRLFVVLEQLAEAWSENGRSGEPPIIAGLALAVLAASEMATDENASQANYYFRLNALLGIANRGKPENFESTPNLWRLLQEWLRRDRRGELVIHGLDSQQRFVAPVQSQCLVRSCDLPELLPVIRASKHPPGQYLEPDDAVPALRAWLARGGASSRLARLLGRDPDDAALKQAAEALCDAIDDNASEQPMIAAAVLATPRERATLALRLNPYPNLMWKRAKWLVRIAANRDADELECLALVGDRPFIGRLDMREPPCYDIEITGDDAGQLLRGDVKVTDEDGHDVTPPANDLTWFQDGAIKGRPGSWTLTAIPDAGVEHAVVSMTAASLGQINAALESPAMLVVSDFWPGAGMHAGYSAVPRVGAILPGGIVASSRASTIRLNGGLRIRRGVYLRGGLPLLEAPAQAPVRVIREGDVGPEPGAIVAAGAFSDLDLPEGRYSLECCGAVADLFVVEPRWRECVAPASQLALDHSLRLALHGASLRGAALEVQRRLYAAYFQPGTSYRLYSPGVVKGLARPDAGIHEHRSAEPIRHATVMGRVASRGPLPRAACFSETGEDGAGDGQQPNGVNRLLEYASARGEGSVDLLRAHCTAVADGSAWHRPLTALEDLGHVDVSWEERKWKVAPPLAVPRADRSGLSILLGARSRQTIDWLGRRGIEAFADPRSNDRHRDHMPDCIVASSDGLMRAANALRDVGLVVLDKAPSESIALQTRSVVELSWWTGPEFFPPLARIQQTLKRWDPRQLRWCDAPDVCALGLYRWRENGRPIHYIVTDVGRASVRDPAAAKWFLTPAEAGYLVYEPGVRRLLVPSAMELPRIWKRICVIASGLTPIRTGRILVYEDIPLGLARIVAVRLNQPRTEGIL